MYTHNDPRRRLEDVGSVSAGRPADKIAPSGFRRPASYQISIDKEDIVTTTGSRSWVVRGERYCVVYSQLVEGESMRVEDAVGEYIIISVDPNMSLTIRAQGQQVIARGRYVAIVPQGASVVTSARGGDLIRVFDADTSEMEARARNRQDYAGPADLAIAGPGAAGTPRFAGGIRVYDLDGIHPAEDRFGRIFRSASLMVNVMYPQAGPRDPEAMSPHSHADFDQCTITVQGDHVHHLRTPWTPIKAHWRADEHLLCHSPSITVIPRGIVHTTEQVGNHDHFMVDVFAPPRNDFLAMRGWVLNAADYELPTGRTDEH